MSGPIDRKGSVGDQFALFWRILYLFPNDAFFEKNVTTKVV